MLDVLKRLGAGRLAAMGAVTIALVGFFAFVIMRFSQPTMLPLFTGLDVKDASAIVKELDSSGTAYELRGDGSTVMVPAEQVAKLRMALAQNGLPSGGGVGYEIFDKGDSLSATSFVQNINQLGRSKASWPARSAASTGSTSRASTSSSPSAPCSSATASRRPRPSS